MDPTIANAYSNGCYFDVCVYEGNSTQRTHFCNTLKKFNDECVTLGLQRGQAWLFGNWQAQFGCSKI